MARKRAAGSKPASKSASSPTTGYVDLLATLKERIGAAPSSGLLWLSPVSWCFSTGRLAVTFLAARSTTGGEPKSSIGWQVIFAGRIAT